MSMREDPCTLFKSLSLHTTVRGLFLNKPGGNLRPERCFSEAVKVKQKLHVLNNEVRSSPFRLVLQEENYESEVLTLTNLIPMMSILGDHDSF